MPIPLWLPFGLLDRMELAPPRVSDTTEITGDPSVTSTLHAQMSTECDCHIGAYGTLPVAVSLDHGPDIALAGGPMQPAPTSRASVGTADVGVFGGTEHDGGQQIYRLGVLVPSAAREQPRLSPSARVGDEVLELPRTTGVRISTSRLSSWEPVGAEIHRMLRFDLGLDMAVQYATPERDRIVHVIPRAGIGEMAQCSHVAVSVESALAWDPFVYTDGGLRWSTGITGRWTRGWFQPALTLAAVRTPDGWGGTIALDLAASAQPRYAEPL